MLDLNIQNVKWMLDINVGIIQCFKLVAKNVDTKICLYGNVIWYKQLTFKSLIFMRNFSSAAFCLTLIWIYYGIEFNVVHVFTEHWQNLIQWWKIWKNPKWWATTVNSRGKWRYCPDKTSTEAVPSTPVALVTSFMFPSSSMDTQKPVIVMPLYLLFTRKVNLTRNYFFHFRRRAE
jgi:hypothetical protein